MNKFEFIKCAMTKYKSHQAARDLYLLKNSSKKGSDAASRLAGWALANPELGSSVNPITTRGVDYAQFITASPPGLENPAASLKGVNLKKKGRNKNTPIPLAALNGHYRNVRIT